MIIMAQVPGSGTPPATKLRDIAEEARAVGYFALGLFGAGQVSESGKLASFAEAAAVRRPALVAADRRAASTPDVGSRTGWVNSGGTCRTGELSAARGSRLPKNPGAEPGLDGRRDRGRYAAFTIEGEKAPLVARKDGDQQAGDQQREQHRILLAALRAYPVGCFGGRSHSVPTTHPVKSASHS